MWTGDYHQTHAPCSFQDVQWPGSQCTLQCGQISSEDWTCAGQQVCVHLHLYNTHISLNVTHFSIMSLILYFLIIAVCRQRWNQCWRNWHQIKTWMWNISPKRPSVVSSATAALECCATSDANQKATIILKYLHRCKLMTHNYVTLKLKKTKDLNVFNLMWQNRQF